MKILLVLLLFWKLETKAQDTKIRQSANKIAKTQVKYHTNRRRTNTAQRKLASHKKKMVHIRGYFRLTPKGSDLPYKINFLLRERKGEHYLTLFVETGGCHYHVRRLTAPMQFKGYPGIIFSNKINSHCDFGILNQKHNDLLNSFELVDMTYTLQEGRKITGSITLSSLSQTYQAQIY